MLLCLDKLLRKIDLIEAQQKATGKNVNDVAPNIQKELEKISPDISIPKMPRAFFNENEDILVRKHHRFSTMITHTHDFIELNYIYSGSCTQYVNGKAVHLPTHSLIMLDKSIPHSIGYMDSNDILVNILLKDGNSLNSILDRVSSCPSVVTQFMYNASKINAIHKNYIIFNFDDNEYAQNLIECLIYKGLSKDTDKRSSMHALYSLLIPEFTKSIEKEAISFNQKKNNEILEILNYIDNNYQQLELTTLAKHFGYNSNYIGNKIKKETGQTFQELIDQKKFRLATNLLTETNYSIENIAERIGYHSTISFFRLFKRMDNSTPNQYRKEHRK